jgi:hypothetical protein
MFVVITVDFEPMARSTSCFTGPNDGSKTRRLRVPSSQRSKPTIVMEWPGCWKKIGG